MFVLAALLLLVPRGAEPRLLVQAPAGAVRGTPAADGDYTMFLGIPYARVNASNPFGASVPVEKFDKVFEATTEPPVCPQIKEVYVKNQDFYYDGTLDCLRLNVFVPNSGTNSKAVYIYVFGGKFNRGHVELSVYGPKYLVRHDIIVVTFNFRIGAYGFMCPDIPEIPGNQGLRDQYDAIGWVKDNIRAFGGDPQKITLGGHSSGAAFVNMHLLSERPRHFKQAIVQSTAATTPGIVGPSDTRTVIDIANKLGHKTNDTYAALSFLAKESPEVIIKATDDEFQWNLCLEKEYEGVVPFVSGNPEFAKGMNIDGLNILGGFTEKECLYLSYAPSYSYLFSRPDAFQDLLEKKFNFQNDSVFVDIVRRFYQEDDTCEIAKHEIVDLLSDMHFTYPLYREMVKYSMRSNTTVYLYMFSYDGRRNRMKRLFDISEAGATHADELGYMFTVDFLGDAPMADDQRVIDQMTTLWANFVKYGNPTPAPTPLLPLVWPPLGDPTPAAAAPCLQIGANLTVISSPFRRRIAFWDLFYEANLDKLKYKF